MASLHLHPFLSTLTAVYRISFLIACALVTLFTSAATAQRQEATLIIRQGARSQSLVLGLDPAATNGLDAVLGEAEVPPMPPSGVFEARFVSLGDSVQLGEGSYRDFRGHTGQGATRRTYQIRFQRATAEPVTVEWTLPTPSSGTRSTSLAGSWSTRR